MTNKLILIAAATAGLLQACSDGNAPNTTSNTMNPDTARTAAEMAQPAVPSQADTAFANKAAIGGMAEVALGKMAAEKAKGQRVKDFGNMMVKDHGTANDELKRIASAENIQLPTDLDAKHKALSDSLSKLSGKAFDKAYVDAMVDGHKKTLALLQDEAANGSDASLKGFAARTATVVQTHLDSIQQIHSDMK